MATLAGSLPTLLDYGKGLDPDGSIAQVIELLMQRNGVLQDMVWIEGNLPTGHRTTVRTGLPDVYWKLINKTTPVSKPTEAQITESIGIMEAFCEVDEDLAVLNGNVDAYRFTKAKAFIQAMEQQLASTLFYGNNGTALEEFNGLDVRYNSTSAGNGDNVVLGGASSGSNNTSIWLITWGEGMCSMAFPKGSRTVGLVHNDLGLETKRDTSGSTRVYTDQFKWKGGLVLENWQYAARICNIDTTALDAETIEEDMLEAYHRIPDVSAGRSAWYMNATAIKTLHKSQVFTTTAAISGPVQYKKAEAMAPTFTYMGLPVRRCDAITNTESTYS